VKRTALLFLTAIYLLSGVGIGVNRFYCCGKLASVTLTYAMPDNSTGGLGTKDNCCRHEKQNLKIKDSHFSTDLLALPKLSPVLPAQSPIWAIAAIATGKADLINYRANAPPYKPAIPIYTINCAYLI